MLEHLPWKQEGFDWFDCKVIAKLRDPEEGRGLHGGEQRKRRARPAQTREPCRPARIPATEKPYGSGQAAEHGPARAMGWRNPWHRGPRAPIPPSRDAWHEDRRSQRSQETGAQTHI